MAEAETTGFENLGFYNNDIQDPEQVTQTKDAGKKEFSPDQTMKDCPEQETNLSDEVDGLQQQLGGYGRYQGLIYFLIGLVYMRGGWHVWVLTLQAYEPGHHCQAAPGMTLNESIPGYQDDEGEWLWNDCLQYVNVSVNNLTEDCRRGYHYLWGDSGGSSPVSKFDLVCEDYYMSTVISTMYMVGTTSGVVLLTPFSDRFGSKTVMLACLWVQAIFATCLVWAPGVVWFCVIKFVIGVCNMTIAICATVLMTETFDASHRELPFIFMQLFWAASIMSLALFGYLMPRWEDVQLTVSIPVNLLSITYIWLIPESLPWLLSKGKTIKAERVIRTFLRINKLPPIPNLKKSLAKFIKTKANGSGLNYGGCCESELQPSTKTSEHMQPSNDHKGESKDESKERSYTVFEVFKHPKLRVYFVLMAYLFLANALAYIGIMYTSPNFSGNRFLNMFLLGLVELPAYVLCYISNRWIGRRRSICIFLFICGTANTAILFVEDMEWLELTLMMIGKFGITGSYSAIYLYAAEVFPTVIRHQAVGACSFFENIGSMAAPSMDLLKIEMDKLPLGLFGGLTMVGSLLVLFLPETHQRVLPQTIEEAEDPRRSRVNGSKVSSTTTNL